jgi:hypothetical protein
LAGRLNYREVMRLLMIEHLFEPWDQYTKTLVELGFRQQCPGDYWIVWDDLQVGSAQLGATGEYFRLRFPDPATEVIWRLTWE